MQLQPLFENVLVKPLEIKKEKQTGIVLPDAVKPDDIIEGTVTAVGNGKTLPVTVNLLPGGIPQLATSPMLVYVNDHVLFNKNHATIVKPNNEIHYLLDQHDIIGLIRTE